MKTLSTLNCLSLDLEFEVAKDKFDADKFREAMKRDKGGTVCNTQSPDKMDYHIHFGWRIRKETVELSVSYVVGSIPLMPDEKEPYAEMAMAWLGQFFNNETAHASVGAYFKYDIGSRKSKFPLPIRMPVVPDLETEIDGVSFNLPSKPNGVDGVLITTNPANMSVQIRGGTRVNFNEFDPIQLIDTLSSVISRLTLANEKGEKHDADG